MLAYSYLVWYLKLIYKAKLHKHPNNYFVRQERAHLRVIKFVTENITSSTM